MGDEVLGIGRELLAGEDTGGLDYWDLLYAAGSPRIALFYGYLYCPRAVLWDEMVLLFVDPGQEEEVTRICEVLSMYRGDRAAVEKDLNMIAIADMFGRNRGDTTEEQDSQLAELVAQAWRDRLRALFPKRQCVVAIVGDEETGNGVGLVVYQEPKPSA